MDYVLPFFKMMDLVLPDTKYFQSVVRQCMVDLRNRYEKDEEPEPYGEWLLGKLQLELGMEAYLILLDWADLTFEDVPADHPHTNIWHYVLRRAANNIAQQRRLALPSANINALLAEFRAATGDRDVIDLHNEQREKELSNWDADVFSRYGLGFDDPELIDPSDWIVNTTNLHRFQLALANLVAQLTAAEVEALRDSVQRISKEDGTSTPHELMSPLGLREPAERGEDAI